jgi:hypothetical protein
MHRTERARKNRAIPGTVVRGQRGNSPEYLAAGRTLASLQPA